MKKALCAALCALLPLSGCARSGSIYANYRDVEDLQLVQTFGYDWHDGEITVTVSSGPGTEELPTALLSASALDIPQAIERLQDWSAREDLFFAHIRYVLIGEEAARHGLEELLDWFERSTQTRLDLPLFVVEGSTAQEIITGSEDEDFEITAVLLSLERDLERRGKTYPFTLRELAAQMNRSGSALATGVHAAGTQDNVPSSPEGLNVLETGYAVFQDWRLRGFSQEEAAQGISLLLNKAGDGNALIADGDGSLVTLELGAGELDFQPSWDAAGRPALAVSVRYRASVVSSQARPAPNQELLSQLDEAFTAWLEERCRAALALCCRSGADFLELGRLFQGADPERFAACSWEEELLTLPVTWEVQGIVDRSFVILLPGNVLEE